MKRPMTLTASILGTVMHSVYSIIELYVLILLLDYAGGVNGSGIVMVSTAIALALSIIALVFNAISIAAWNKSQDNFKKKRKFVITAIVFNFIVILFIIIGLLMSGSLAVLDIITLIVLIAANVLFIVDLAIEKKRFAQPEEVAVEAVAAPKSDIEAKIEKLNDMKAQGLISDEEYEELKKSYIKEKVNG